MEMVGGEEAVGCAVAALRATATDSAKAAAARRWEAMRVRTKRTRGWLRSCAP